jgi:alanyl-tRNA synthetase
MQVQVDIGFDQLVQIAKRLPATQWSKLKKEVETAEQPSDKEREEFRKLLLSGPTFSKKQLDNIAETRKKIDEWRTK